MFVSVCSVLVDQYLLDHPVAEDDIIHFESGAWVNKDGDFGSPEIVGWAWPPTNATGGFDIENGWVSFWRLKVVVICSTIVLFLLSNAIKGTGR